jgi:hypothetical protein
MAGDWTVEQNDSIVADYFAMLADDIVGRPYSKAQHNRLLQAKIDRPRGSIEYKHQNISAVLKGLGEDWIPGYKPAFNFQASLIDAVVRWLDRHPNWVAQVPRMAMGPSPSALREDATLWIGPPPTHSNMPAPNELEQMTALARKYDVAERIRWVSHVDGDGAGYDILSFDPDSASQLIEVKTTNGWERTPFHITRNELAIAKEHRDEWRLVRLWNFAREPRAFELRSPLEAHVSLMATSYQANF